MEKFDWGWAPTAKPVPKEALEVVTAWVSSVALPSLYSPTGVDREFQYYARLEEPRANSGWNEVKVYKKDLVYKNVNHIFPYEFFLCKGAKAIV